MKILVTGSRGFIGSRLLSELLEAGHDAVGTDIRDGLGADLREPENIERLLRRARAEVVVHLAHQHPRDRDDAEAALTNLTMATAVARCCGQNRVRLVYGSSSAIYGDGASACRETEGPFTLPSTITALSTLWGEQAGKALAPDRFTSVRMAGVYGPDAPGGADASAPTEMLWRASRGLELVVEPGFDRSWCWIDDLVRGIRIAIESGDGPLNVGRDDEVVSMARVAELACIITGASFDLIEQRHDSFSLASSERRVSSSRLQRLGWRPSVSLYDGMVMLYENWVGHLGEDGQPLLETFA